MIKINGEWGCVGITAIMIINAMIGGWAVDMILSWFGKSLPFCADMVIGLFTGELAIPIAIVGNILRFFGVF
jgi:hypothetical protein